MAKSELELKLKGKIPGPDTGIEIRNSVCAICDPGTQCGLDLYVKDGRIIKTAGTKANPRSHGSLCSKGAATRQYVYSPDRVMTPLRRIGERGEGRFEPISWDDALDEIVQRFSAIKADHGAESVLFYAGYAKWFRAYLARFAYDFGSPNYFTESSTCNTATVMAQKLTYGSPAAADFANTNCALIWSCNFGHSHTPDLALLNKRRAEGMKLIVVDPRVTKIASDADIFLQIRPGTDGALALAMGNVIVSEKLYDQAFVAQWTSGFDEYAALVAEMTPERAGEICDVDPALIRAAAHMYADGSPSAIYLSASPVVHHTNGVQNYRAVSCLIGLTGNIDVAGGNRMNAPSLAHMPGGFPTREHEFVGASRLADLPERIGDARYPVWAELVEEAQGTDVARAIRESSPYPVKALLALGLNHRMFPDSEGFIEAVSSLDFFVDVDPFLTDSAAYADIVLPACTSVERREARCWPMGYAIFTQPAISPVGEARSDVDILCELARRLNLGDELLEGGMEACLDWILEPSGLTVAMLDEHPEGMWVPGRRPPEERKYLSRGFATPSGKVEFKSSVLAAHADYGEGFDALPTYREPRVSPVSTPDIATEYPLVLVCGAREPMFQHSRTFRVPWNRALQPDPLVRVSPQTARAFGVKDGEWTEITTPQGSIVMRAKLDEKIRPGDVHLYHDWPQADGNTLIAADYTDPISGFPGYRSQLCTIAPANAEQKEVRHG